MVSSVPSRTLWAASTPKKTLTITVSTDEETEAPGESLALPCALNLIPGRRGKDDEKSWQTVF